MRSSCSTIRRCGPRTWASSPAAPCSSSAPPASTATSRCRPIRRWPASAASSARSARPASTPSSATSAPTVAAASWHARSGRRATGRMATTSASIRPRPRCATGQSIPRRMPGSRPRPGRSAGAALKRPHSIGRRRDPRGCRAPAAGSVLRRAAAAASRPPPRVRRGPEAVLPMLSVSQHAGDEHVQPIHTRRLPTCGGRRRGFLRCSVHRPRAAVLPETRARTQMRRRAISRSARPA